MSKDYGGSKGGRSYPRPVALLYDSAEEGGEFVCYHLKNWCRYGISVNVVHDAASDRVRRLNVQGRRYSKHKYFTLLYFTLWKTPFLKKNTLSHSRNYHMPI